MCELSIRCSFVKHFMLLIYYYRARSTGCLYPVTSYGLTGINVKYKNNVIGFVGMTELVHACVDVWV